MHVKEQQANFKCLAEEIYNDAFWTLTGGHGDKAANLAGVKTLNDPSLHQALGTLCYTQVRCRSGI
jgi:hypothetical protein